MNSLKWQKLIDLADDSIPRATRFLVKNSGHYESLVEFFLVEDPTSPSAYSIYVSTGHKAGCLMIKLPLEARLPEDNVSAISKAWLIDNWRVWIIDTDPSEVLICRKYDPGV